LNFVPHMDAARLVEGYRKILRTIYSPAEYYQGALDCLSRLTEGPEPRRSSLLGDAVAFARVVTLAAMGYHFRKLTEAYGE
jgi:hypothetical protein